jgi:hypothetical protein
MNCHPYVIAPQKGRVIEFTVTISGQGLVISDQWTAPNAWAAFLLHPLPFS